MITVSKDFKTAMQKPIKELDAYIQIDEENKMTSFDDLISIKVSCEASLCKTAMRKLEASYIGDRDLLAKWVQVGFGVKLPTGDFEYINYGSFLVSQITFNKETGITEIIAYDKMVSTMVPYVANITEYPISLFDYTKKILEYCGLELGNETFIHANWQINSELFENIDGITFRDVLVQIAQATASTCIISNDDKVYFKTINTTDEILTYDNLISLKLEPKYGEINSVVLSRTPQEDNIYLKDDESIQTNGLTEFKIENNEIIDRNRETAIINIYNELHGVNYYPFEINTEGLGWFEIADSFNIKNDLNEEFNCTLFNFSITVDGSINETLNTKAETKTQTQYQYATSIGKRVKNAEIIVDKQNQKIDEVVSEVDQYSEIISEVEQTVDEINQRVSDVENLEREIKGFNYIHIPDAFAGDLLNLTITGPLSFLYLSKNLYPSKDLYPLPTKFILVIDKTEKMSEEAVQIELPIKNLKTGEKFIVENNQARLEKVDGTVEEFGDLKIPLFAGENYIHIKDYEKEGVNLYCKYVIKNNYTDMFATKRELNSSITQTNEKIETEVSDVNELLGEQISTLDSKITQTANNITSEVSKKVGNNEIISKINQSAESIQIQAAKINFNGLVTANNNFVIEKDGSMKSKNGSFEGNITGGKITIKKTSTEQDPYMSIQGETEGTEPFFTQLWTNGISVCDYKYSSPLVRVETSHNYAELSGGNVNAFAFNNVSLAEKKKNFEPLKNAIDIVSKGDIYRYNWKNEKDTDKKHIGLIVGKNYNAPKEVISQNEQGIDTYSMVSVLWQAIKEQQKIIENLTREIELLKDKIGE